jgi:hypothetical protein
MTSLPSPPNGVFLKQKRPPAAAGKTSRLADQTRQFSPKPNHFVRNYYELPNLARQNRAGAGMATSLLQNRTHSNPTRPSFFQSDPWNRHTAQLP